MSFFSLKSKHVLTCDICWTETARVKSNLFRWPEGYIVFMTMDACNLSKLCKIFESFEEIRRRKYVFTDKSFDIYRDASVAMK